MNIRVPFIALALLVGASFATDPRFEQGARFLAQGEYEKALGEYRAVLAEQPQNSDAYFAAAEVYIKMPKPDYSRALANYRLAYKFTPTMSAAYEGAAKVYEKLGQKAKAEAELAKDPKNRPPEPAATEPVAEQPAQAAAPVAAAPAETAATQVAPAEASQQSAAPVAAQEPAPAQPARTAAAPAPAEPAPAAAPAPTQAAAATPQAAPAAQAAAPAAEEAVANPDDPFEKGKAYLAEGNYKEAAKMWREVLAKTPGHVGAYYFAGVTRYQMGEYDKAEFNLNKGKDYKDAGADVHYYLAQVYKATKKQDQEKKSLAAYIKKSTPNAQFRKDVEARLAELKNATADSAKGDANAAVAADAAVPAETAAAPAPSKISPAPAKAYSVARANELFKAGSFEEALQVYKVMLESEISPDERYFSLLQMGNIYRELRDFHSAASRYREVVQQFPDSDWATEAQRALEDVVWLEKHASELPRRKR
jgi:pentatricopeptide repeat protein